MMKFALALIGVLFFSMADANAQTSPTNVWDPRFDKIEISQRVGTEIREIVAYDFKKYWPAYPFTVRINDGPIVIFPKIGPPPIAETDPTIQWDRDWVGELYISNNENSEESELVAVFNEQNQSQGITIPQSMVSNRNTILIYIYSIRENQKVVFDRFMFSLSGLTEIDEQIGGEGVPGDPGTVIIQIPCYVTNISSPSNIFTNAAGSFNFSVNLSRENCTWTISTNVSWITVAGELSRTGNSTVAYSVAENTTTEVRTGSVVVGGQTHTVIQRGRVADAPPPEIPCVSIVLESVREFPQNGGSSSYTVSLSRQDCTWSVSKNPEATWLTVSGSSSRTGNSTISYTVAANETTSVRTARITTSNSTHVVVQQGKPIIEVVQETPCYSTQISEPLSVYSFQSGTGSFNITSSKNDCTWTITKDAPWITIQGATTRSGSGTVTYSVSQNTGTSVRTGTIFAFNHRHSVVQMPEEKSPEPEQQPSRIDSLIANVISDSRVLSSTQLLIVDPNSTDPILVEDELVTGNPAPQGFGYIQAWGRNNLYQYGDGTRITFFSPQISIPENIWSEISAGVGYAAAIDRDGVLHTWGSNTFGQLGTGDTRQRTTPARIESSVAWKSVSAGRGHTLLLSQDGRIWSIGRNLYGQLGNNTTRNSSEPIPIESSKTDWQYIFASADSSYAIDSEGRLFAWGYNNHGQLGSGDRLNSRIPIHVATNLRWKKVVSGESHVLGITTNGMLYAWGRNNRGQLGTGNISFTATTDPVRIGEMSDWLDVAAGFEYSMALRETGEVFSFGVNNYGQLGVGDIVNRTTPTKVNLPAVARIFAGYFHSVAIQITGDAYSWGRNEDGQLGLGFNNPRRMESPIRVSSLQNDVLRISLRDFYSLAIRGVEEEQEESGGGPQQPIQLQSVILVPVGNSISISWKGTTLAGRTVSVLLRRGSETVINQNYSATEPQTLSVPITQSGINEYVLVVVLQGVNQSITTKFIIKSI
jgi:alpha-tubulin suppressor-like RCC1 family protein